MNNHDYYRHVLKNCPWVIKYHSCKNRCQNKNNTRYKRYGGRGIKFLLTQEDIKKVWFRDNASKMKSPSIDRINNNGHYEPKNIRFVEFAENSRKRIGVKLSLDKAIEIRKLHKAGHSFASIGRKFNVCPKTAAFAVKRKTWTIKTKQAIRTHKGESNDPQN